jgi:hypothetical protein
MKITFAVGLLLFGLASTQDLEVQKSTESNSKKKSSKKYKKSKSRSPTCPAKRPYKPSPPKCPAKPKQPPCKCELLEGILDALRPPCRCGKHSSSEKLCDIVLANGYTNIFASSSLARSFANNAQNG